MRKEATQNQCWRVPRGKPCLRASPAEEAWWQDREPALCAPPLKKNKTKPAKGKPVTM